MPRLGRSTAQVHRRYAAARPDCGTRRRRSAPVAGYKLHEPVASYKHPAPAAGNSSPAPRAGMRVPAPR
jgi:hypothetical protein